MDENQDLYSELIGLNGSREIEPLLEQAGRVIRSATGAREVWLSVHHPLNPALTWSLGPKGPSFSKKLRRLLERDGVAGGLKRGDVFTVVPGRESDRPPVVLCAPIGSPSIGTCIVKRAGGEAFTPAATRALEDCSRHLSLVASALLLHPQSSTADPTRPFRSQLSAHHQLIGRSPALARVLKDVTKCAGFDVSVLLQGPTGTGKTALARLIHDNSRRAKGPFVRVNCGAVPAALFESSMFGHTRGAFTGASATGRGWVGAARGGTLFLDEVAELIPLHQAKLLSLLDDGSYFPVGSSRRLVADVRIVAATHVDLRSAVRAGTFRRDLYHRLAEVTIRLPALTERRGDIPELADHLLARLAEKKGLPAPRLDPQAAVWLCAHAWPGNIRELSAVLLRGLLEVSGSGEAVSLSVLLEAAESVDSIDEPLAGQGYKEAVRHFKTGILRAALERHEWVVARAARAVGLTPQGLHHLKAELGLRAPGDEQ